MATPIERMPVEATQGDLEIAGEVYHWPAGHTATSADGAVFIEVGPVSPMRDFHDHVQRVLG